MSNIDRSRCEEALSDLIAGVYSIVNKGIDKSLCRGHIERLCLVLNDKMKKVEFLFDGSLTR